LSKWVHDRTPRPGGLRRRVPAPQGSPAKALEHYRLAQQYHAERRDLIRALIAKGFSQADIGRELGVTRQAVQKMLAG